MSLHGPLVFAAPSIKLGNDLHIRIHHKYRNIAISQYQNLRLKVIAIMKSPILQSLDDFCFRQIRRLFDFDVIVRSVRDELGGT